MRKGETGRPWWSKGTGNGKMSTEPMASAVTSAQVTQPHFQEHLISGLPGQPCSSLIIDLRRAVLPALGVACVRVSSPAPCLLIPPNPSQPVMVGNLSPMCHAHGEQSLTVHWCHQVGHLSGRTGTLLTHICACPTLRR